MTDSDITGNIIADCGMTPQTKDIAETHDAGCTCECCCLLSDTNCEDNIDQCETPQTLGGKKKMRSKLPPILANCALILAVVAFSSSITRAGEIHRYAQITIDPAVRTQIAGIPAVDPIQADSIIIEQGVLRNANTDGIEIADIVDGSDIALTSSTKLIDDHIDVGNLDQGSLRIDNVLSPIEPPKADKIVNASINDDIDPTIQN